MSAAELRKQAHQLLRRARVMETSPVTAALLSSTEELMRRSKAAIAATRRQLAKAGR